MRSETNVAALVIAGFVAGVVMVFACSASADAPRAAGATKQAAPAKRKPVKVTTSTQAAAPLTAESLGLGDISLASIMAPTRTATSDSPPAAATTPPPPPAAPIEEPSPSAIAIASSRAGPDKVLEPERRPRRRLTIGINPLPVVAGRYGLNVEIVPFAHHALVASGFFQTFTPSMLEVLMPDWVDVSKGAESRFGGELGYRWYSSRAGAHGLFVGASGVAMPLAWPRFVDRQSEVVSFQAYGGALDVGAQLITSSGFTFGGGVGGMYLAYDAPTSTSAPPGAPAMKFTAPHVLPRVLLAAGWSF